MNGLPTHVNRPPLNFSTVIDLVRRVLIGHYRLFLALGSVPAGALILSVGAIFGLMFAFGLFPTHGALAPDPRRYIWSIFPVYLVSMLPMMVAYVCFEGAVCAATLKIERGQACTFSAAMSAAGQRIWRLLWLVFLRYLYVALPATATIGVFALMVFAGGKHLSTGIYFLLFPLAFLSYLGAIVYAVWMTIRLCAAVPAALEEERSAPDALDRSAKLTRGSGGRIFLVLLVVYAISCAAMLLVEMAAFVVGSVGSLLASLMGLHAMNPAVIVVTVLFGLIGFGAFIGVMILTWSSYAITCAVIYADRREPVETVRSTSRSASHPVPGGGPA